MGHANVGEACRQPSHGHVYGRDALGGSPDKVCRSASTDSSQQTTSSTKDILIVGLCVSIASFISSRTYRADLEVLTFLRTGTKDELSGSVGVGVKCGARSSGDVPTRQKGTYVSSSAFPSLPAPGIEMAPISDPSRGLLTRTRYRLLPLSATFTSDEDEETYRAAVEASSPGREDRLTF